MLHLACLKIFESGLIKTKEGISIPGYAQEVAFDMENPYSDM
ncbi:MAG: hypothetical protein P8J25_01745 [Porticoccaceae bacterium]|nr:hypothetical protein [Porticoccaceae bacterium]